MKGANSDGVEWCKELQSCQWENGQGERNIRKDYTAIFSSSSRVFPSTPCNLSIETSALAFVIRVRVGRSKPRVDCETCAGIKLISLTRGINGMQCV